MCRVRSGADHWNTTELERRAGRAHVRSDGPAHTTLTRGIDVDAPSDLVFRWLCQLRVAPYSYDWINNFGRRSPRRLSDGADQLAVGQRFLALELAHFEPGREITTAASPLELRLFGVLGFTYRVIRRDTGRSRILVLIDMEVPTSRWRTARHVALSWVDLLMVRKQLRTIRKLAEQQAADEL